MNSTPSETKRLADAVASLATTITEIIEVRLQATGTRLEVKIDEKGRVLETQVAQKTLQPIFNKRQAADYYNVSVRTIENWLSKGYLPYYKIGKMIRIPMQEAEFLMRERCLIRRRSR